MNYQKLYKEYWQEGSIVMRLLILHTIAYLLIGLVSWGCTLITPLRWWDLGLSLSFYPEWDKVLYHLGRSSRMPPTFSSCTCA